MSTVIRNEISKKNRYYISKHRMLELKHFCLQYEEWRQEYVRLTVLQGYGYGNGDEIVNVSVYIPETLSRDEKQAFEKMRQSDNFQPNQSTKSKIFNRFKQMFE